MNKIFIEAQDKTTPEYNFLKTMMDLYFPDKQVDFICMGGVGNLFNETNINQISQAQATGEQVIVLIDADTIAKGYGYEKCVSGTKDELGQPLYHTPNLKGKLHTYMNAQKLSNKVRSKLGSGDWLFNNTNYWDLNVDTLQPLKDFLTTYLK